MNILKKLNHYQIIFLITLIFVCTFYGIKYQERQTSTDKFITAKVVRVIDGDTIVCQVDNIQQPVRMIGIDTPESVHPDTEKILKPEKLQVISLKIFSLIKPFGSKPISRLQTNMAVY